MEGVNGMDEVVYTAGYGDMVPEDFVTKLKDAGVTFVLDVRREGCKSWNARYTQGPGMKGFLKLREIDYIERSDLGNKYITLDEYTDWLAGIYGKQCIERMALGLAAARGLGTFCLVCAEGDVFEKDGTTPRCHRYYVGLALAEELGEGWRVKHI